MSKEASNSGEETNTTTNDDDCSSSVDVEFQDYRDESQLEHVMECVQDLSEPYSIFTYRYFLHRFPELCLVAVLKNKASTSNDDDGSSSSSSSNVIPIGVVVGKIDKEEVLVDAANHNNGNDGTTATTTHTKTGYIGMLAVSSKYRRQGIGKKLVHRVLQRMKDMECTSVTLETEVSNVTALKLYQDSFGFCREELLVRYYLNWGDAYRLRLWFPTAVATTS